MYVVGLRANVALEHVTLLGSKLHLFLGLLANELEASVDAEEAVNS